MSDMKRLLDAGSHLLMLEAVLLDEQRWDEWLNLFTSDCEYWVPTWTAENQLADDPQSQLSHIYYSRRTGLEDRIARIRSKKSPASSPMRRTTHLTSNILLLSGSADTAVTLRSSWNCHVFDPNSKKTYTLFGWAKHDLVFLDSDWRIAKKKTVIQNDYLPSMVDVYCI